MASQESSCTKRKLYDDGKQLTEEYMALKKDVNDMKKASKILRMSIEKSEQKVENFSKTLHDFLIVALKGVQEEDEEKQGEDDDCVEIKEGDKDQSVKKIVDNNKEKKIRKYKQIAGNWICPSCLKAVKPTSSGKVKKTHSKNNACIGGGLDAICAANTDQSHEKKKLLVETK